MKKAVIILALLFLMGSVSALEMTRIYGFVDPDTELKLSLSYYANNVRYEQLVIKKSNYIGAWEHRLSTDAGTIDLKVIYRTKEETYSIPAGKESRIDLFSIGEETKKEDIAVNQTEELNTTAAISTTSSVENSTIANETIEGTTATKITGGSIFDSNIIKTINIANLKTLKIILIIFGLFVFIVIANLVSFYLAGIMFKPGTGVPAEKIQEKIKIIKLSEKVAQAQKEIADAEKQIEEFKKKVEKVEVFS